MWPCAGSLLEGVSQKKPIECGERGGGGARIHLSVATRARPPPRRRRTTWGVRGGPVGWQGSVIEVQLK